MRLFAGCPVSDPKSQCHGLIKQNWMEVVVKNKIGKRLWMSQKEDRKETVDEPAVPTHHEAFASFSTCNQWVEGQLDCDIVSILLLHRLQQKAMNKHSTALKQQSITSFFSHVVVIIT